MASKPVCLMGVPLHKEFLDSLSALGLDVIGPFPDVVKAASDPSTRAAEAEYMVTFGTVPATRDIIASLPKLRSISCYGSGYEGVDLATCLERNIICTHSVGANANCVADVAFALVLSITRRISAGDRWIRTGEWERDVFGVFRRSVKPKGLGDMKMGILGMGEIGLAVAGRALAFNMEVGYCNRSKRDDVDAPYQFFATPHDLAQWCDVLVLCLRADKSTYHIINASVLDALGPEGFIVNISRGTAIDEKVLIEYLKAGKIAGAGLDVFEEEPKISQELLELGTDVTKGPYVTLTPHVGGLSTTAANGMSNAVLRNVEAILRGETPPNVVPEFKEMAKTWKR